MPENQIVSKFGRKISSSHISNTGREQGAVVQTNSYVLNKVRALQKKLHQCGQEHLRFQMKPDKNFVIKLSTSAYELTKLIVVEHLYSENFAKDYFVTSCINEDECQNQVGSAFRVYNRKKDGMQGTKLKFTLNFYHTTSSILVNGSRVDIFESELFRPICESIESKCTDLTIVNEQIADILSPDSEIIPQKVVLKQNKAIDFEKPSGNINSSASNANDNETPTSVDNLNSENETGKLYFCPVCEESAQAGSVACEECGEWYHFACVGLNEEAAESIHKDVPFVCIYCNDNILYNNSNAKPLNCAQDTDNSEICQLQCVSSDNNVGVQSEQQSDITLLKQVDQSYSQNVNCDSTKFEEQNIPENTQNKKQKLKKTNNNNTNKKQAASDSNETLIAQKYYISSLESKVNHLENTVNLLQNTLENKPQSSTSPTIQSTYTDSDVTTFRHIEHRLNLMETHMVNNLQMQNQMALQNQMNLHSLFQCQNQLIIGLADRQYNPYARMQPPQGFQYLNPVVQSIGNHQVFPGLWRAPPMYQYPVPIPPPLIPQQVPHPVILQRPVGVPGPAYVQQRRPPNVSDTQKSASHSHQAPAQGQPMVTVPHNQLTTQTEHSAQNSPVLPRIPQHNEQDQEVTVEEPHGIQTEITIHDTIDKKSIDTPHIDSTDCDYSSVDISGFAASVENSDTLTSSVEPQTSGTATILESAGSPGANVPSAASKTCMNSGKKYKNRENVKDNNKSDNSFLIIPSLKENPPEIEPIVVERYPDVNRQ